MWHFIIGRALRSSRVRLTILSEDIMHSTVLRLSPQCTPLTCSLRHAGTTEPYTFAQLREQHSHLKPSHLTDILAHYTSLKEVNGSGIKVCPLELHGIKCINSFSGIQR